MGEVEWRGNSFQHLSQETVRVLPIYNTTCVGIIWKKNGERGERRRKALWSTRETLDERRQTLPRKHGGLSGKLMADCYIQKVVKVDQTSLKEEKVTIRASTQRLTTSLDDCPLWTLEILDIWPCFFQTFEKVDLAKAFCLAAEDLEAEELSLRSTAPRLS